MIFKEMFSQEGDKTIVARLLTLSLFFSTQLAIQTHSLIHDTNSPSHSAPMEESREAKNS